MAGVGGSVNDKPIGEVVAGLRALLKAIDEGRMTCSPAYRNRLQGAVVVLEVLDGNAARARVADDT